MRSEKYSKQDEQLYYHIQNLQQGDTASYGEIYNLSGKYLYKIIYDIVQDHHTTEDMLQETFLRIYNNIGSLKSPKAYYVWAGRIATNLCIRHLQKYRKEVLQAATDDGEGNETFIFDTVADDNEMFIPESVIDNKEHQKLIAQVIDSLSPEQKLAVQCFYFEEMSVKEIAALMECSEGTIKSRLNYARKSIKEAVLDIEKKDGTKLYSLGAIPILLMLFRIEAEASVGATQVAGVGVSVSEQVAATASATSTTVVGTSATGTAAVSSVATTATAVAAKTISAKVIALIIASFVVAGAVAAFFVMGGGDNKDDKTDKGSDATWQDKVHMDAENNPVMDEEIQDDSNQNENSNTYIIQEGGKYIIGSTGEELQTGDNMPAEAQRDDFYYYGDYKYISRGDHWGVEMNVEDYETRTSFGAIIDNIAGEDVEDISSLFYDCKSMIEAPEIPATVNDIDFAFAYCESMIKAPNIPSGVYSMNHTFVNCTSLMEASNIPDGVINMTSTFERCSSLKVAPKLPAGVTNLQSTFFECKALEEAPEIPSGVKSMNFTFAHCTSLKKAPIIPDGVESMGRTFAACFSLTQAPEIPEGVTDMTGTFYNCTGLRGNVVIHANPTEYEDCFEVYDFDSLGLEFSGLSTMLEELKSTGYVDE